MRRFGIGEVFESAALKGRRNMNRSSPRGLSHDMISQQELISLAEGYNLARRVVRRCSATFLLYVMKAQTTYEWTVVDSGTLE